MKRFFKMLAVVLALTLVIGTIPASAATEVTLKKTSKTLYLGGCIGAKTTGKKAPYYATAKLKNLLNGFDSETMKVRATSDNTAVVKTSTTKLTAVSTGTANVTIKVYKTAVKAKNLIYTFNMKVTVKKNASAADLTYTGITDGASFTVGDSVTVTLPKGSDNDYRRLTVKSGDVTVKKTSGTNKWKVTFNKEGSFELLAESYQSSTYKKATQSKTIKGTIKAAVVKEEPKPVAKQSALDSFTIENVSKDLEKDDIKVYTMTGSVEIPKSDLINTVTVKDGVATVKMYANLDAGATYYVEINGNKTNFTATSGKLEDVKSIKITTTKAKVGVTTDLECAFYSAAGIDITSGVKKDLSTVNLTYALIDSSGKPLDFSETASVGGHTITFNTANKPVLIKATLTTGYDTKNNTYEPIIVEAISSITGSEDEATGDKLYTFTTDDGVYMTAKDKLVDWFTMGDSVCVEALFKYTDDTYKTFDQMGVTSITSANEAIVMIQGKSASQGYKLSANNAGKTSLLVKKGDTIIATIPVEVKPARKVDHFDLEIPKLVFLNTSAIANDSLIVKAKAYDQYGEVYTGATFSAVQTPDTITATGTVSAPMFVGGTLLIRGTDISLNPNPAGGITLKITCNELSSSDAKAVTFYAKEVAPDSTKSVSTVEIEGPSLIDTTLECTSAPQEFDPTVISAVYRINNYYVGETVGKCFTAMPSAQWKNTDPQLACSEGDVVIGFTITRDGTLIDPSTEPCIEYNSVLQDYIEFNPITVGHKLPKGNYVIRLYKITAGASASKLENIGQAQLKVVDGNPDITFVQKADYVATSIPGGLTDFFDFYCDGNNINSYLNASATVYTANAEGTSAFINTVSFDLPNGSYGVFTATLELSKLIHTK